jgi:hypothetical protein
MSPSDIDGKSAISTAVPARMPVAVATALQA